MAEVYVAKTQGIGGFEKLLAIKVIHPTYSEDEQFITMLVEEAKLSVLLNHNNVVQTFDLGCTEDTYFIAMELVEGADCYRMLKALRQRKALLPLDICAYIVSAVCSALDYAHRKRDSGGNPLRIVHRDVSPQNVLVSFSGDVKLADFGIAKAALRTQDTQVGIIKGKYYYMSPEQAWGDPMDHRSDIFSAGGGAARAAHRRDALSGRQPARAAGPRAQSRAAAAFGLPPRRAVRAGRHHHEGARAAPRRPLRVGSRPGPSAYAVSLPAPTVVHHGAGSPPHVAALRRRVRRRHRRAAAFAREVARCGPGSPRLGDRQDDGGASTSPTRRA
jgi:serine/threonine protein kinase